MLRSCLQDAWNRGVPAGLGGWRQTACKPGSVRDACAPRDGHSSGTRIAACLARPTRTTGRKRPRCRSRTRRGRRSAVPIRSCSRWGLPCRRRCRQRGALLPHRFALARNMADLRGRHAVRAVCFLWHCPWGRPRRPLAGTVLPWSPDFPPSCRHDSDRPAVWRADTGGGTVSGQGRQGRCPGPAKGVTRSVLTHDGPWNP